MTDQPLRPFDAMVRTHQRELHVHCYQMLASYDEADDAVQETFLRAWRSLTAFDDVNPRARLYAIASFGLPEHLG